MKRTRKQGARVMEAVAQNPEAHAAYVARITETSTDSVYRARFIARNGSPDQVAAVIAGEASLMGMFEHLKDGVPLEQPVQTVGLDRDGVWRRKPHKKPEAADEAEAGAQEPGGTARARQLEFPGPHRTAEQQRHEAIGRHVEAFVRGLAQDLGPGFVFDLLGLDLAGAVRSAAADRAANGSE